MSRLAGRGVVLTGASGGIGAALCDRLVAAGAKVHAIGRDADRLAALAKRHPGCVIPLVADITRPEGIDHAIRKIAVAEPPPSMLILAAAVSCFGRFDDLSLEMMTAIVETNLVAPMRLIQALLPQLAGTSDPAVVVIGSTFGSIGFPGFAAYSASKFGLRGLTEALAREYADGPVRFQYLSPRATRTPINPPAVVALNRELGTAVDEPDVVARQLMAAIERGDRRRQLGFPEKLFARVNGALPALVDRALAGNLPIVQRHARAMREPPAQPTDQALSKPEIRQ
jgi:short-subunit dehydrogenase